MTHRIARAPLRLLRLAGVRQLLRPLLRERASVFMLHRFRCADLGVEGHDPAAVRPLLEFLRRERFELVSLRSVFRALRAGEPLRGAVAFTIDDGYRDQAEIAGPLFAEFDCPVSTFLCTGFLDGQLWMWWDKIEHALRGTPRRSVDLPGAPLSALRWESDAECLQVQLWITEHCKRLPESEKNRFIAALAEQLEVELPAAPPARYAPMSWDDARHWEQRGMSFGPHSLTHPILARTEDAQSRSEIEGSQRRVVAELGDPDPIFCYPNGQAGDFGERECSTLARLGLDGAVTGLPGYAAAAPEPEAPYRIRRFSFPEEIDDMLQCVSGLERLKALLRSQE